jgi:hypothetical protein
MKNNLSNGFIAITTTMILSVILLVVATSLSFSGFFTRYNILDSELKKISIALAEGCVDQALLKLATNSSFSFPETVNINENTCQIINISSSGYPKTIKTRSEFKNYVTNLEVEVGSDTLNITKWEEVASP